MKNKKTLIAVLSILLAVVVGITIAYLITSMFVVNVFNTGDYQVVTA